MGKILVFSSLCSKVSLAFCPKRILTLDFM